VDVFTKFFTENLDLGGSNLLETETKYNAIIEVPIEKWLYSYNEVGLFDSFDGIDIDDEESFERVDFAFLTKKYDEDEKEGMLNVHANGCCYE